MSTKKPPTNLANQSGAYLQQAVQLYQTKPIVQVSLQLLLSVFTVAFFILFAIRPTLATITVLQRRIQDQQEVDQKLDTKIRQLQTAQENLQTYANDLSRVTLAIPTDPDLSRVDREIEAIANESGIKITSLQYQPSPLVGDKLSLLDESKATPPQGDRFVTFSLSAGGSQSQLTQFLQSLISLDRAVVLTQSTFSVPEIRLKEDFPLLISIRGTIYYLPTSN